MSIKWFVPIFVASSSWYIGLYLFPKNSLDRGTPQKKKKKKKKCITHIFIYNSVTKITGNQMKRTKKAYTNLDRIPTIFTSFYSKMGIVELICLIDLHKYHLFLHSIWCLILVFLYVSSFCFSVKVGTGITDLKL